MDPVSLAVGGLLALVFGVAIFNSDDDSGESSPELGLDPETGTVTGTDGDDAIDLAEINSGADQYSDVNAGMGNDTVASATPGDLQGEGGNDVLTVTGEFEGVVDGGTGNDLLSLTSAAGDLLGGEGNDTINFDATEDSVYPAVGNTVDAGAGDDAVNVTSTVDTVLGGAGNDTISYADDDDFPDAYTQLINSGDGDDLIIVDPAVSIVEDGAGNDTIRFDGAAAVEGVGRIWFSSGEGNDVYELSLLPDEGAQHTPDPDLMGYASTCMIEDFETGVDTLVVDPYSQAGDATYTGYELILASGTGHQQVVFHYTHPDYPDGLSMAVSVNGGRISLEDVQITGAP